jgi:hypothetical protein
MRIKENEASDTYHFRVVEGVAEDVVTADVAANSAAELTTAGATLVEADGSGDEAGVLTVVATDDEDNGMADSGEDAGVSIEATTDDDDDKAADDGGAGVLVGAAIDDGDEEEGGGGAGVDEGACEGETDAGDEEGAEEELTWAEEDETAGGGMLF